MTVTDEKLDSVARTLWADVYETAFRGKSRGRFCLTREQMKQALDVKRLHPPTIQRLQDVALRIGLVIIDLDDLFPCVEIDIVRRYRRPPSEIFGKFFPEDDGSQPKEADDDD